MKTLDEFDFRGKVTIVRVDFNSPVDPRTKRILDDSRIRVHSETIRELSGKGARIVVLSHQGRPGGPEFIPLEQHAHLLGELIGKRVRYTEDLFGERVKREISMLRDGEVLVLGNVRKFDGEMNKGSPEEHSKSELVRNLAPLADVFVLDAFSSAHRAHASIVGFTPVLPSLAGRVMERELKALEAVSKSPKRPCIYILGGIKIGSSLKILTRILEEDIADLVLTGGVPANLVLLSKGFELGEASMGAIGREVRLVNGIKKLIATYPSRIRTPVDLAIDTGGRVEIGVKELPSEYKILDIGSKTIYEYSGIIKNARSVVFSGPMGVFEREEFEKGTREVLEAIASSKAFSLVGGGHSVAAVKKFGLEEGISYVSTAGGALMAYLMKEELPGVKALEEAAKYLKGL